MNDKAKVWFPFFVGDYLADTMHLTTEEHGAYLLILCHQWRQGHMQESELVQVTRLSADAWSIAQARLKHMLRCDSLGLWFSPRLDREKELWDSKRQKSQEKAKKAANARWKRTREGKAKTYAPSIAQALPEDMHDECPSPSPGNTFPLPTVGGEREADGAGPASPGGAVGEVLAKKTKNAGKGTVAASKVLQATSRSSGASGERVGSRRVTLHDHAKANGNGKSSRPHDPKFFEFRDHLMRFYAAANSISIDSVPWGVKEDRALVERMRSEPKLAVKDLEIRLVYRMDAIRICLEHPRRKGNVLAHDPLNVVLDRLPTYRSGPVDAFGEKL